MLKLFGVALAGMTATGALSACASPQPKYPILPGASAQAASASAAVPAAETPSPSYTAVPFGQFQGQAEASMQAPMAAPAGIVDSASLPVLAQAAAPPPSAADTQREPVIQPTASAAAGVALSHKVGAGETFFAVGRRYGVSPQAVADANGLTFADTLKVGQTLQLPVGARDRGPQAAFPGRSLAAVEPAKRPTRLAEAPGPGATAPTPLARPTPPPARVTLAPLMTASVALPPAKPVAPAPSEPVATAPVTTAPVIAAPTPLAPRTATRFTATPAPLPAASAVAAPTPQPLPSAPPAAPMVATAAELAAARGRFVWPVRGEVLSAFGPRGPGQRNDGLNIAVTEGESIRAAATGEVVYAGDQVPGFGKLVLLKHPDGWVTAYAHLSEITVKMREQVRQSAELGKAGRTGAVPSPQLHFEVRHAPSPQERARPVDPMPLLP